MEVRRTQGVNFGLKLSITGMSEDVSDKLTKGLVDLSDDFSCAITKSHEGTHLSIGEKKKPDNFKSPFLIAPKDTLEEIIGTIKTILVKLSPQK